MSANAVMSTNGRFQGAGVYLATAALLAGSAIGFFFGLNGSFRSQSIVSCLSGHDNKADIRQRSSQC
jgi:hypothetical protein